MENFYRFFFQDRKVVEHLYGCPRYHVPLVLVLVDEHLGVLPELACLQVGGGHLVLGVVATECAHSLVVQVQEVRYHLIRESDSSGQVCEREKM